MVSSAITPTRTIAVLIGVAVIAVAGFAVVRSGIFEPDTVQGAIPGPGSSSPSVSASASPSAPPPPAASPSPTTPEQIKAKNIADAKARLVKYYETTAQVANNGYRDWNKKLDPFWGHPDVWGPLSTSYANLDAEGQYTTGAASVESMRVVNYEQSAEEGFAEVSIDACIDFSQVRNFSNDGEVIPRQAGAPTRYQFEYVMSHPGANRFWTVYEQVPHPEQAC
ncbi:hypothetical protein C8K30_103175 [Promicromonospora sp. AC04]|uniref:hypothetical protein n=1 Tax=Promicromonospora sp. AC04 TaxID=2135723 RepID=UPI000D420CD4|nr:hypothetical protein [Promicromonospora sp. AC04]PUB28754.1 hypothetical protein C8K30_103175 [Promicromonospora sp. AC04]